MYTTQEHIVCAIMSAYFFDHRNDIEMYTFLDTPLVEDFLTTNLGVFFDPKEGNDECGGLSQFLEALRTAHEHYQKCNGLGHFMNGNNSDSVIAELNDGDIQALTLLIVSWYSSNNPQIFASNSYLSWVREKFSLGYPLYYGNDRPQGNTDEELKKFSTSSLIFWLELLEGGKTYRKETLQFQYVSPND